jgi:hypothetical protein
MLLQAPSNGARGAIADLVAIIRHETANGSFRSRGSARPQQAGTGANDRNPALLDVVTFGQIVSPTQYLYVFRVLG